ncbi:MAG TPA: 3-isopropylmalate dehydrogenase, partial [Nitrospira sp.]|nr:3-isopropylmalate dehydrogenase [Nitrospira sp.]
MNAKIAVLAGDGVGREIVPEAVKVLKVVAERYGHTFDFISGDVGGHAIDKVGVPLPAETLAIAKHSDAVLLGAVGGPKWDVLPREQRPERGLLGIRKQLGLFANLRPAILYPQLAAASTLKSEIVAGLDILIVRELTGDIYF